MDYPSHAREICPYWYCPLSSRSFSAHRYKAHLFECAAHDVSSEYSTVQCAYCPGFVLKENLKKHYRKCPGAVVCIVCEEATSIEKAEEHASQHSQACPYWYFLRSYVEFPVTALSAHTSHCGRFPAQSELQVANCEHCKRTVDRAYIREHLEECQGAEQCPVCFGFFSRREIDDHTQACALQVSMDRQAQVTCPICQQQVSQHGPLYTAMEDHLRTHEAVPSFNSPPSYPDIIDQSGENGYKYFSYEELQREKQRLEQEISQESVERRLEDYSFGPENYEVRGS